MNTSQLGKISWSASSHPDKCAFHRVNMQPSKPAVFALLHLIPNLSSWSFILGSLSLFSLCCPSVPPLIHCSLVSLIKEIYCSPASPFACQAKHLHSILRFQWHQDRMIFLDDQWHLSHSKTGQLETESSLSGGNYIPEMIKIWRLPEFAIRRSMQEYWSHSQWYFCK